MRILPAVMTGLVMLVAGACAGQEKASPETLVVFAASSLTNAFTEMTDRYEQANPDVDVELAFAASSTLRLQLEHGAYANVFASANERQLQLAQEEDLLEGQPIAFASAALTVAARPYGPVSSFEDLASPGVRLVLADEEVPAGAYARQLLRGLARDPAFGAGWVEGVLGNVVSREPNVRQVLAKVQLGAADAAIVYATDLASRPTGQVAEVGMPLEHVLHATYWIGLAKGSGRSSRAGAFIDLVRSEEGRTLLAKYGFGGAP